MRWDEAVTMRPRPDSRDVARLAGVAVSSVSRVLSGHPDVSPAMRERVMRAVEALGYEPDIIAQSLRLGATRTVGFVLGDISNPILSAIVGGAEKVLRRAGYSMLLMDSGGDPALDREHLRFFLSRRVDGMILSLASERERRTAELLAQAGIPIVLVDRDGPGRVNTSRVLSDHADGMRKAVRYLIDSGHRDIALVTGAQSIRPGRARAEALRATVEQSDSGVKAHVLSGTYTPEYGYQATMRLLSKRSRPTAVISGGNQLLVGCLKALQEVGVQVGQEISLVSCDDVPLAEFLDPPVATISRDCAALGQAASELLLSMLGGADPTTRILPTDFVPRPSVGTVNSKSK